MNLTTNVVASISSGIVGMLGVQAGPDFAMKDIASWGAGGIVAATVFFMLRWAEARDRQLRAEHANELKAEREAHAAQIAAHLATNQQVAAKFGETTERLGETTATLLREARADSEKHHERMQSLFETLTKAKT